MVMMTTRGNQSGETSVEQVVLVDANDTVTGRAEKMLAHQRGLLHRAFSVFVMNPQGAFLLQKRSSAKYHSGGLWSNAACGHPRPSERLDRAARRRLKEELGLTCTLIELQRFTYRAELAEGVIEHEIDHVFVGNSDSLPRPNPEEVDDWKWCTRAQIDAELAEHPDAFTAWFAQAWAIVCRWIDRNRKPYKSAGDFAA
jgi:isopentenyl-diphosphate delta-isomerase